MRAIIAAITLVFVIGAALPTSAGARAPRTVERWGCIFRAGPVTFEAFPDQPVVWYGRARVRGCDKPHRFRIILDLVMQVDGAPDRVRSRARYAHRRIAPGPGVIFTVRGGRCSADGAPPTPRPVYVRMRVKRVGRPGVVRVAGPMNANPCQGVADIP